MKQTAPLLAATLICISGLATSASLSTLHASPNMQAQTPANSTPDNAHQKTRLYLIRVIDATSRTPVTKAKVTVELSNPAKTKWAGSTDSDGVFQFKWDTITPPIKAHISIQAPGYMLLDDYNLLIEDRLIQLNKAD